jgi:hypothetical protein
MVGWAIVRWTNPTSVPVQLKMSSRTYDDLGLEQPWFPAAFLATFRRDPVCVQAPLTPPVKCMHSTNSIWCVEDGSGLGGLRRGGSSHFVALFFLPHRTTRSYMIAVHTTAGSVSLDCSTHRDMYMPITDDLRSRGHGGVSARRILPARRGGRRYSSIDGGCSRVSAIVPVSCLTSGEMAACSFRFTELLHHAS